MQQSDVTLQHFGIPGMRWGHRKDNTSSSNVKRAKVYSKTDQEWDKIAYGKRGVKHIQKRMDKGDSHMKAEVKEALRQTAEGMAVTAALLAAPMALSKVSSAVKTESYIRGRQKANKNLAKIGTMKLVKVAKDVYRYQNG